LCIDAGTVLHYAIDVGNLELLRQIMDIAPSQKTCIGAQGERSPLMHAASCGRLDMCKLLLEQGADPKVYSHDGENALSCALLNDLSLKSIVKLVEFLIKSGVPVGPPPCAQTQPILTRAIEVCLDNQQHGDGGQGLKLCELLIRHGTDVNAVDGKEWTALHMVSFIDSDDIIFDPGLLPLLVKNGAAVNARDKFAATPLHVSVVNENVEAVRQLLAYGADVTAVDNDGHTPLHLVGSGNVQIAILLLEAGASIFSTDKNGATPEEFAAITDTDPEVYAFLKGLREKAELEVFVSKARTPHLPLRL
jgi:ankyrin repeat protein